MRAHKFVILKDRISLYIMQKNCQAMYTKVSKFYLIMRPLFVAFVVVVVTMDVSM